MITAFTICANNYLAHAQTLATSFKKHHPEISFYIAILDEPHDSIAYDGLAADQIVWVAELFPELIEELKDTYNIAELCTVVKPKLFAHFFTKDYDTILYIDPDIKVFSCFDEVFSALQANQVVLTPHICSPTGEAGHPQDKDLMRTGIYNLGFLALKKTAQTLPFIEWWDKRVRAYGFHDLKKGFFYDQIWLGYAPAFLDRVFILRHLGYNVANWNLHERKIINEEEQYFVNDTRTPLVFFHYSHFKMENLPIIASYNQNFTIDNRPDIEPIFKLYISDLIDNKYNDLKKIPYLYGKKNEIKKETKINHTIKSRLKRALAQFIKGVKILFGKE